MDFGMHSERYLGHSRHLRALLFGHAGRGATAISSASVFYPPAVGSVESLRRPSILMTEPNW